MAILEFHDNVTITFDYKYFLKSSRKMLTKTQHVAKSIKLRRNKHTPLMFVRAPKHFKSGKQHVFFFNSIFRVKQQLNLPYSSNEIVTNKPTALFNKVRFLREFKAADILINRVTFNVEVSVIFE